MDVRVHYSFLPQAMIADALDGRHRPIAVAEGRLSARLRPWALLPLANHTAVCDNDPYETNMEHSHGPQD